MHNDVAFILNNSLIQNISNPAIVLLDFLRKDKRLTGTKEVCKEGDCGACAVLVGELMGSDVCYKVINSCLYPLAKLNGKHIVTIEGLNQNSLNPIQLALHVEGASQCGFCTPGFVISLTGFLLNNENIVKEEIINSIAGNICRCTGYHSIIRAVDRLIENYKHFDLKKLISEEIVPEFFEEIPSRLQSIENLNITKDEFKDKVLISGGTDLFVQKPDKILKSEIEIIEKLSPKKVEINNDFLELSGSITVEELKSFLETDSTDLNLKNLFNLFASLPIRNSATIAGNLVNASPIGDITISLIPLDTELILRSSREEERKIDLKKFFLDYKKLDKRSDEIIDKIIIKIPPNNAQFNFEKVSKRRYLDIASVNSSIYLETESEVIKNSALAAGGVAPVPLYLQNSSDFLKGKSISNYLVHQLIELVLSEISPISDIRGSVEYKKLLLSQLIKAHFLELYPNIITPEVIE